ncbi:MAG: DNA methyltransferase [Chloroflexi bacterium GWB2_49_20]|nr:MAG: DNA methyltransferase [Chloroflexi bacterium GWB2_49_20]OGN76935.1 MAG: DNA methyltransferase [Chloroflexi bacterium GWC2_49_37]OGN84869.1 MAG: DNA methyltransferase [Chloroflexi bacterium GWD2_49_16]HCM96573.1 DNA methyltransferase [Anaerolineae bacterium]
MNQLSFFDSVPTTKPVNVASVPQRSPFRYPGGKTWLIPFIRKWMSSYDNKAINFYEPFVGGGIVGLTIAFEQLAKDITLVELDVDVASVWKTILSNDYKWLANKIVNFDLTQQSAERELNTIATSTRDQAFQTILRNRISHGGILAPGAGNLKYGEGGKGILSRWYPYTLFKRIYAIGEIQDRIRFIEGDGLDFIRLHLNQSNAVFFIDPPYTAGGKKAGSRLYTHYLIDHEELFNLASQIKGDFLMTYDNSNEVYELAKRYNFNIRMIAMNNTHHAQMTELLISNH